MKKLIIILLLTLSCNAKDFCSQFKEKHYPSSVEYDIYYKNDKTKSYLNGDIRQKYSLDCRVFPNYKNHNYRYEDEYDLLIAYPEEKEPLKSQLISMLIIENIGQFSNNSYEIFKKFNPDINIIKEKNYSFVEYAKILDIKVFQKEFLKFIDYMNSINAFNNYKIVDKVVIQTTRLVYHNRKNLPYLEEYLFKIAEYNNDKPEAIINAYLLGELLYNDKYYYLKY